MAERGAQSALISAILHILQAQDDDLMPRDEHKDAFLSLLCLGSVQPLSEWRSLDIASLAPTRICDLDVNLRNKGRVLNGYLCSNAIKFPLDGTSVLITLEGMDKEHVTLLLKRVVPWETTEDELKSIFPWRLPVAVKEPHVQPTPLGNVIVVENPNDFEFDSYIPSNLKCPLDVNELRRLGKSLFEEGRFSAAAKVYELLLSISKDANLSALAHSNRAACFLRLHYLLQAVVEADDALSFNSKHLKSFYRKAIALKGLHLYEWALQVLEEGIRLANPNDIKLLLPEFEKCKKLALQSRTGHGIEFFKNGVKQTEFADYIGPIEVKMCEDHVRGRGLFATSKISKHQLIMACNPLGYSKGNGAHITWSNMVVQLLKAVKHPRFHQQLYSLDTDQNIVPPMSLFRPNWTDLASGLYQFHEEEGIKMDKLIRISATASFGSTDDAEGDSFRAFWPLPYFMNHSCVPNVSFVHHSGVAFYYAVKDIEAGEELVHSYISPGHPQRRDRLKEFFTCTCQKCVIEEQLGSHLQDISDCYANSYESELKPGSDPRWMVYELERLLNTKLKNEDDKQSMRSVYWTSYLAYYDLPNEPTMENVASGFSNIPTAEVIMDAICTFSGGHSESISNICALSRYASDREEARRIIFRACQIRFGKQVTIEALENFITSKGECTAPGIFSEVLTVIAAPALIRNAESVFWRVLAGEDKLSRNIAMNALETITQAVPGILHYILQGMDELVERLTENNKKVSKCLGAKERRRTSLKQGRARKERKIQDGLLMRSHLSSLLRAIGKISETKASLTHNNLHILASRIAKLLKSPILHQEAFDAMVKLAQCVSSNILRDVAADIATSLKLLVTSEVPFVPGYVTVAAVQNVLTAVVSACERGPITAPSFALIFPIVEHILLQPVQSASYEDMVHVLSIHSSPSRPTPPRIIRESSRVSVLFQKLELGNAKDSLLHGVSEEMLDELLLRSSHTVIVGKRGIDGQCLAVDRLLSGAAPGNLSHEFNRKIGVVDSTLALASTGNALVTYCLITDASAVWEGSTKRTDTESMKQFAGELCKVALEHTKDLCIEFNKSKINERVTTAIVMIPEGYYRFSVRVPKNFEKWDTVQVVFLGHLYDYTVGGCGGEVAMECLDIGESVVTDPYSRKLGRCTGQLHPTDLINEVARAVYHASDGELVGCGINMCFMGCITEEEIKKGRCAVARWANGYEWSLNVCSDEVKEWSRGDRVDGESEGDGDGYGYHDGDGNDEDDGDDGDHDHEMEDDRDDDMNDVEEDMYDGDEDME